MRIIWQTPAKIGRRQVTAYIYRRFGIERVKQFRRDVDQTAQMIMRHPNIGSIDPLFENRPNTYRSVIINGLSKMVYFIEGETL